MKRTKLILLMALALMGGASVNTVHAQNTNGAANREARKAERVEKRVERMVKALELKEENKEAFSATYRAYLTEMEAVGAPEAAPAEKTDKGGGKKKQELTEAEATQQVQDLFRKQEQRIERLQKQLEVQKKYYPEFAKVLTPVQILKVYSVQRAENGNGAPGHRAPGAGGQNRGGNRAPRGGGFGGGFDGPGAGFGGMD